MSSLGWVGGREGGVASVRVGMQLECLFLPVPMHSVIALFLKELSIEEQSEYTQDFYQNVADKLHARWKGTAIFHRRALRGEGRRGGLLSF